MIRKNAECFLPPGRLPNATAPCGRGIAQAGALPWRPFRTVLLNEKFLAPNTFINMAAITSMSRWS